MRTITFKAFESVVQYERNGDLVVRKLDLNHWSSGCITMTEGEDNILDFTKETD